MHSSIVLMVMTRCAALAALTLALTLTPSLSGGDIAEARPVKQKTCDQKYFDCIARCNQSAIEKYGGSVGVPGKTNTEANNCEKRTCMPQLKKCLDAKKKPTMSEQPLQPLKPPVGSRQPQVVPGLKQQ